MRSLHIHGQREIVSRINFVYAGGLIFFLFRRRTAGLLYKGCFIRTGSREYYSSAIVFYSITAAATAIYSTAD